MSFAPEVNLQQSFAELWIMVTAFYKVFMNYGEWHGSSRYEILAVDTNRFERVDASELEQFDRRWSKVMKKYGDAGKRNLTSASVVQDGRTSRRKLKPNLGFSQLNLEHRHRSPNLVRWRLD